MKRFLFATTAWVVGLFVLNCAAQPVLQNKAQVRAIRGVAHLEQGKDAPKALRVGMSLPAGTVIETGASSTVDLFLGDNGPVLRMEESSKLGIKTLEYRRRTDSKIVWTEFDLLAGVIKGNVRKLSPDSVYQINMPGSMLKITGSEYQAKASGEVSIISGKGTIIQGAETWALSAGEMFEPVKKVVQASPPIAPPLEIEGCIGPPLVPPSYTPFERTALAAFSPFARVGSKRHF